MRISDLKLKDLKVGMKVLYNSHFGKVVSIDKDIEDLGWGTQITICWDCDGTNETHGYQWFNGTHVCDDVFFISTKKKAY